MLDDESTDSTTTTSTTGDPSSTSGTTSAAAPPARRRRAASRPAGPPVAAADAPTGEAAAQPADRATPDGDEGAAATPAKRTRKRATKATRTTKAAKAATAGDTETDTPAGTPADVDPAAASADPTAATTEAPPARKRAAKRGSKKAAAAPDTADAGPADSADTADDAAADEIATAASVPGAPGVLFQPPEPVAAPTRRRRAAAKTAAPEEPEGASAEETTDSADAADAAESDDSEGGEGGTRRRRRGGRGRRGRGGRAREDEGGDDAEAAADESGADSDESQRGDTGDAGDTREDEGDETGEGTRRRRRRRRRGGGDGEETGSDDPPNTVVRVREPRKRAAREDKGGAEDDDGVRSVKGSTRLEAKKQRRREGREAGRRRPPVITEAEFLARREAVDRVMVVRQTGDRTQIAVLEDGVLAEHYVSTASSTGLVGNVYLGKVQNVLPSMEAAFVDIGKGRNAVLYAGEVNWDAAGLEGQPRRIELALKSGDPVLVQVTKDPIGHKGARLTSQVSLAGRYLVLVPGSSMTGISRKLPETERTRLKTILKKVVPEGAGVIVRTAAEGASEDELSRDVARLTAQWEDIEKKSQKGSSAPAMLYGEPDMTIRVVRDIFNEDFSSLVVSGDDAWDMLEPYVGHVAPDLRDRMSRWTDEQDAFTAHRIDEQLAKAMDRKVWLPSGGYLIIDRTEAMIVVDVNTGKFTGQGGNLEETVTKNNLEAAEEIVRQLRLRDLGGIIVIDFIDMVLESNRDLVLRRLLECLGRDRTKHQVAEVTSLGLVQMTRKRVGQGLYEAFSTPCEACNGRGYHVHTEPVESKGGGNGRSGGERKNGSSRKSAKPGAPKKPEALEAVDASPVAVEDPVAVADPVEAPTLGSLPLESDDVSSDGATRAASTAAVAEPPASKPKRRRRAVSPTTTV
jgi:ribonuclease E